MNELVPYIDHTAVASLQILDEAQEEYRISSRAPATRAAYAADWENFTGWCQAHGFVPLPAPAVIVGKYLTSLAIAGKSVSTIGRRLAAIRFAHKQAKLPIPKSDELTETLSGIRRSLGVAPTKQKSPATIAIVKAAIDAVRGNTPKDIRDKAILAIGFGAALRRSEITGLDVSDIEFDADGLRLTVRRSKTDQNGVGAVIGIPLGNVIFPSRLVKDWLEISGITRGALFTRVRRGGRITSDSLAPRNIAAIVKARLRAAGLETHNYSGHSLRAGFVTSAVENDVNLFKICDTTRHKQLATLKMYDRRAKALKGCAAEAFL